MKMTLLQADSEHVLQRFRDWGADLWQAFPDIVAAIIVFLLVILCARLLRRIVAKYFFRHSANPAIATVMSSFFSIIFIIIGLFVVLGILGLNQTVTSLLAGAGILGLILGLALQDTLASAIAGVVMTMRKSYKVGDFVESNDFLGTITEINLRNTTIRQTTGVEVKIPNKLVLNNPLINYTLTGERRVDISFQIGYEEDLQKVESLIRKIFSELVAYNKEKVLEIYFTDFQSVSISVLVRFWIKRFKQQDFLAAQSEAVKAIKIAFDAEGIKFPLTAQLVQLNNTNKP